MMNTDGNGIGEIKKWDEHPDMDEILRAIENSNLMTEDISNMSDYSLNQQMRNHANFTIIGLTTADKVTHSITDQDHFPYTRKYRGEIISDDPIVMDRLAGYRPRQDAAYACSGISTGIANLTGSVGNVCGAAVHKNSLGVGASEGNFEIDPSIGNSLLDPLYSPDYSAAAGIKEKFTTANNLMPPARVAVPPVDVRNPSNASSTYPTSTVVPGGGRYERDSHGSVGGRSAYPRTQFQGSCKVCDFSGSRR